MDVRLFKDPFIDSTPASTAGASRRAHFGTLEIDPQIFGSDDAYTQGSPHIASQSHHLQKHHSRRHEGAVSPSNRLNQRGAHASPLTRSPPQPHHARSSTLPPGLRDGATSAHGHSGGGGSGAGVIDAATLGAAVSSNRARARKNSVTQNARLPKHERRKSREVHSFARDREKDKEKRLSSQRDSVSVEPSGVAALLGKRWEDLIDAAASATEEDSRDLTPVPPSPQPRTHQNRSSLPPYLLNHHTTSITYNASPLARVLTPPPPDLTDLEPFPSVESSIESKPSTNQSLNSSVQSGRNFHISGSALDDTSPSSYAGLASDLSYSRPSGSQHHLSSSGVSLGGPLFPPGHLTSPAFSNNLSAAGSVLPPIVSSRSPTASPKDVHIYCAGCGRLSALHACFACTECICGLCRICVDAICSEQARGRSAFCPGCRAYGSKFKPFQLEIGTIGSGGGGAPSTSGGPVGGTYARAGIGHQLV